MEPITFSTAMVQAILDGRKTQTRRVVKPQPCETHRNIRFKSWFNYDFYTTYARFEDDSSTALCDRKPRYKVGDTLYVRETWYPDEFDETIYYKADYTHMSPEQQKELFEEGWRPSVHMPKEAARLFLRVTGVRCERLQKITPEDAVAEGAVKKPHYIRWGGEKCLASHQRYKKDFQTLWDSLNAKRGYGWESNPWVFVYEFERITKEEAEG